MKEQYAQKGAFAHALNKGIRNTTIFIGTAFFGRIGLLCALPYITTQVSLEAFGVWDLCQTVFLLASTTISSIACASLTRFFLCASTEQERTYAIAHSWIITGIVGVLMFGALCIAVHFIPLYSAVRPYWFWIGCNSFLFACVSVVLQLWKAQQYLYRYVALYMANSVLLLASMLFLLKCNYAITAQLWSITISLVICVPFVIYSCALYRSFDRTVFVRHVTYGLPLLAYGFLYGCFMSIL